MRSVAEPPALPDVTSTAPGTIEEVGFSVRPFQEAEAGSTGEGPS
jgi:hypothetical protein